MAQTLINAQALQDQLTSELAAAMEEAAEPLVQKALKDIERVMRERLAVMMISRIERDFDMQNSTDGVVITLRQASPETSA